MTGVKTDIGTIHFVGIGGIGMSGIAEVMHNMGFAVQGSDVAEGYVVQGLRRAGIAVTIGQAAANIAFSIAARGEFALILVTLAAGADLDERLAPFVAIYVLVLALVSPILAHRSATFVRFIPRRLLPEPVSAAPVTVDA